MNKFTKSCFCAIPYAIGAYITGTAGVICMILMTHWLSMGEVAAGIANGVGWLALWAIAYFYCRPKIVDIMSKAE